MATLPGVIRQIIGQGKQLANNVSGVGSALNKFNERKEKFVKSGIKDLKKKQKALANKKAKELKEQQLKNALIEKRKVDTLKNEFGLNQSAAKKVKKVMPMVQNSGNIANINPVLKTKLTPRRTLNPKFTKNVFQRYNQEQSFLRGDKMQNFLKKNAGPGLTKEKFMAKAKKLGMTPAETKIYKDFATTKYGLQFKNNKKKVPRISDEQQKQEVLKGLFGIKPRQQIAKAPKVDTSFTDWIIK